MALIGEGERKCGLRRPFLPPHAQPRQRPVRALSLKDFDQTNLKSVRTGNRGANFPNQAYRYGQHAVGLQFHPEVTYHMMCRWTHRGAERMTRPGALSRPEHLGGWFQHDGRVAAWLEAFLPAWLAGRLAAPAPKARPASPLKSIPERHDPAFQHAGA